MRHLGMNKKALHWDIIVIVIFSLLTLIVILFFSGQMAKWVNQIVDKLFGG